MKAEFSKTVDILVKAYLNGTLINGHPCGCAVGNIIANKLGFTVTKRFDDNYTGPMAEWDGDEKAGYHWFDALRPKQRCTYSETDSQKGEEQMLMTGYSIGDIDLIEAAFEGSDPAGDKMFNGLMAVVSVLAEIHGISLDETEEAKKLFVKLT